jgi:hypothetical protein
MLGDCGHGADVIDHRLEINFLEVITTLMILCGRVSPKLEIVLLIEYFVVNST